MTSYLTKKAVVGRRVLFDHAALKATLPGIITELNDGRAVGFYIRLDGQRSSLFVPADTKRITYLDVVTAVPDLPMGRFTPTADDFGGDWEGVPVCQFEDEGIALLTDDRRSAAAALHAFCKDMWIDRDFLPPMDERWVVFEWQPEGDEYPWVMQFADEGDDQAIRIHYLPA